MLQITTSDMKSEMPVFLLHRRLSRMEGDFTIPFCRKKGRKVPNTISSDQFFFDCSGVVCDAEWIYDVCKNHGT